MNQCFTSRWSFLATLRQKINHNPVNKVNKNIGMSLFTELSMPLDQFYTSFELYLCCQTTLKVAGS